MAWSADIKTIQAYIPVMTQEQFERLEDAILSGEQPTSFTMREVMELETKLKEKKEKDIQLSNIANLNNNGIQTEKEGDFELAVKNYEQNVSGKIVATHSYERLMVIYRKAKMYDDELRVIDVAIEVFKKENERRFQDAITLPKNKEYILDIKAGLETCSGIKNREGWYIFSPYPVLKYNLRREKAIKLREKFNKEKRIIN